MTEAARLEGIIALTGLEKARSGLVGLGKDADKAQTSLDGVSQQSQKTQKQTDALGQSLLKSGRSMQQVGGSLTRGVTLPLGLAGAAMLKVGTDFESQMSKVEAKSGATAQEIAKLRQQALRLGADTSFSAKEAAQGMEELAAAGMKPNEVMAAMPGLLDAAAASGEGVAAVAGIVANSLAQFNLEAGESNRIADVLAKGSNETQASIGSMGEALKYAGTQASQLGFDLEETVGMTSMMVKAGIDGGQAGTALRMGLMQTAKGANASKIALSKLATVSPELAKIWKSAAPVPQKIEQMSSEFQKLDGTSRTVAAGLIFGTEASSGMLEVLKGGPGTIDKWTASMRNSRGEAERMGDTMRNNLKGDIEALGGSIESAMISMFSQADGPLRGLTQTATGAVNAFGGMGPAGQTAALGFGVLTAAAGPALIVTGKLVEAYGTLKSTTAGAALSTRFAALALNPYAVGAVALGAAVLGVTAAVKKQNREEEESRQNGVALAKAVVKRRAAAEAHEAAVGRVRSTTAALNAAEEEYGKKSAQYRAALDARRAAASEAAATQRDLNAAVKEAADADAASNGAGADGGKNKTVGERTKLTKDLIETERKYTEAIRDRQRARAQIDAEQQTGTPMVPTRRGPEPGIDTSAADTLKWVTKAQNDLNKARDEGKISGDAYVRGVEKIDQIEKGAQKRLSEASKAHDSASDRVKKHGDELAAFHAALGTMPKRSADASKALMDMARTPANLRAAKDVLSSMSRMERKVAFGTADINTILSMIGNVTPSSGWVTSFASDLAKARQDAARPITVTVQYRPVQVGSIPNFNPTNALGGGRKPGKKSATGGKIIGPGTGTSDDIPVWLSNGEHVWTAAEVRAAGGHGQIEAMRAAVKGGDMPKFADGGAVGKRPVKGMKETPAAYKRRLAAWNQRYAAAQSKKDLGGASFAADTTDPALLKKQEDAQAALNATIIAQSDAKANKPAARNEVISTAKRRDALQKQYDSISGKGATERRRALKPQLDAAKKAAAAAEARLKKINDTIMGAADRRTQLAAEIVGYGESLDASSEAAREKSDAEKYAEEDLRREALGLESQEEEKRREKINAYRRAAGLPEISASTAQASGGVDAMEPDLSAQLAQATKRASDAEANFRLSQAQMGAFTGSGDLGFAGGANAWQSANGAQPVQVYVQSLTGYSPEIREVVGDAAGGGFTQGGNAFRSYSGRG